VCVRARARAFFFGGGGGLRVQSWPDARKINVSCRWSLQKCIIGVLLSYRVLNCLDRLHLSSNYTMVCNSLLFLVFYLQYSSFLPRVSINQNRRHVCAHIFVFFCSSAAWYRTLVSSPFRFLIPSIFLQSSNTPSVCCLLCHQVICHWLYWRTSSFCMCTLSIHWVSPAC
jgi:hypothetical protein